MPIVPCRRAPPPVCARPASSAPAAGCPGRAGGAGGCGPSYWLTARRGGRPAGGTGALGCARCRASLGGGVLLEQQPSSVLPCSLPTCSFTRPTPPATLPTSALQPQHRLQCTCPCLQRRDAAWGGGRAGALRSRRSPRRRCLCPVGGLRSAAWHPSLGRRCTMGAAHGTLSVRPPPFSFSSLPYSRTPSDHTHTHPHTTHTPHPAGATAWPSPSLVHPLLSLPPLTTPPTPCCAGATAWPPAAAPWPAPRGWRGWGAACWAGAACTAGTA